MSLVGYGGKQDVVALSAESDSLEAEARGTRSGRRIALPEGSLTAYPVEHVIEAVRRREERYRRMKSGVSAGKQVEKRRT